MREYASKESALINYTFVGLLIVLAAEVTIIIKIIALMAYIREGGWGVGITRRLPKCIQHYLALNKEVEAVCSAFDSKQHGNGEIYCLNQLSLYCVKYLDNGEISSTKEVIQ